MLYKDNWYNEKNKIIMKLRQILTTLAVLAGLFVILVSWQVCLPGGCIFDSQTQTCQDGNCFNEDIGTHLQERLAFLTATSNNNFIGSLLILSIAFFLLFNNKILLSVCYYRFRTILKYFSLNYNSLNFLFAKGLLHPKIY